VQYELEVDGYRAIAFKSGGKLHLLSRNNNDFSGRYAGVLKGLAKLPNETVIDGEIVAVNETGRPSFNARQNYASTETTIVYYVFDLLVLAGRDVRGETLITRRTLLERRVVDGRATS
jgi:bifunctional non-homologous end joining protein LigD